MKTRDRVARVGSSINLKQVLCLSLNLETSLPQEGKHVVYCTHGHDVRPYKNLWIGSRLEDAKHRVAHVLENTSWTVFSR